MSALLSTADISPSIYEVMAAINQVESAECGFMRKIKPRSAFGGKAVPPIQM